MMVEISVKFSNFCNEIVKTASIVLNISNHFRFGDVIVKYTTNSAMAEPECSICQEIFRDPKVLPCGHSFCLQCLQRMAPPGTLTTIRCPLCQHVVQLPGRDVTNLPTNFALRDAQDARYGENRGAGGAPDNVDSSGAPGADPGSPDDAGLGRDLGAQPQVPGADPGGRDCREAPGADPKIPDDAGLGKDLVPGEDPGVGDPGGRDPGGGDPGGNEPGQEVPGEPANNR